MTVSPDGGLVVEAGPLVAGGAALGRLPGGEAVLVDGALPGERVFIGGLERRRGVLHAHVVDVLTPSPSRVKPPCRHVAEGCGGCQWQHLAVEHQRLAKTAIVRDAYRRIGRRRDADHVVQEGRGVAAGGYRTTLRLVVSVDQRLGFRARREHRVVAADGCLVADPQLHPALAAIAPERRPGDEVALRCSRDSGAVVAGDGGPIDEMVGGARFRISPRSFFQSGPEAAALLVSSVSHALKGADERSAFVDLYAGVGLFSATVGSRFTRRVLVERNASAVQDARLNIGGLAGSVVVQDDVERWRGPTGLGPAVVVADPSRAGLGRRGVEAVMSCRPQRLVLVSCAPAAAARDAVLLETAGLTLRHATVLDLFPHTFHCEVVARFDRRA